VVNAKDLLQAYVEGRETTLSELSRPMMQVSEAALIDELLRDMRRRRMHMAVVVDEHGTATGLVTIEDILEEIVGEIDDHHEATISGHLLEKLGRVPEVGELLEIEGRPVEVTQVGEARIDQLRVPGESPAPEHRSG
jgi:CBS domain containing-hemolysin-like protein